ncbi:hypothetical protein MRX96_047058 [Rhipicephalus microplus]
MYAETFSPKDREPFSENVQPGGVDQFTLRVGSRLHSGRECLGHWRISNIAVECCLLRDSGSEQGRPMTAAVSRQAVRYTTGGSDAPAKPSFDAKAVEWSTSAYLSGRVMASCALTLRASQVPRSLCARVGDRVSVGRTAAA